MQIISPLGGRFHDGQEFILVYLVIDLVLVKLPGHTDYEAKPFFVGLMAEHGSYYGVRGVGLQDVMLVSVREGEYDVTEETLLEVFKGSLFDRSPVPNPFSGQGRWGGGDGNKLRKELMIETTEAEK